MLMRMQRFFHLVGSLRDRAVVAAAWTTILLGLVVLPVGGVAMAGFIVASESFDGYDHFPEQKPAGDPVNLGVPLGSEGADLDLWMAARLEQPDDGPIAKDIGVQSQGGSGNSTPVGRTGDDAALVLRLDLTNLTNITLDFDWRTFSADSPDRLAVAYYVGDGTAFQPEGLGMPNGVYDWYNDPELGGGVMDRDSGTGNSWYQDNWTEIMRASPNTSFTHKHFDLTLSDPLVENDILYIAFWMDNGDNDYGKIDNVEVRADYIPEPSTGIMALVAAAMLGWFRRRRR